MKSLLFFPFILLAMLFAWASKTFAQNNTETRNLEAFESVKLIGSPDVLLTQGTSEKAEISTQSADISVITEVKKGVLYISLEDKDKNGKKKKYNNWNKNKVKLNITYKNLKAVEVTGSGNMELKSPITMNNFEASVTGSGNIEAEELNITEKLTVSVTGSGNLEIEKGNANVLNVNIAGSGNADTKKLTARQVNVNVAGSGNANVYAQEAINANVGGSGNITYAGKPAKVSKNVQGSGSVKGK